MSPASEATRRHFLFSYFTNADNGATGMRLAISEDGLTYHATNGGRPFLTPDVGESKLMRDPFLLKDPRRELYHLVWTTSWKGKTIGYASSTDLVNWSEQRAIAVMASLPGTQNCWAPEIIHDPEADHFVVFWSSTVVKDLSCHEPGKDIRDHRLYCVTTKDFETFSEPKLLLDPGFNVIDASYLRHGDRLIMFIKDERTVPEQKNIRWLGAETPLGPFATPSEPITHSWVEGPSAIQLGEETIVFFDQYRVKRYGAVATRNFKDWYDATDRISMPAGASHGSIIAISPDTFAYLNSLRDSAWV